MGAEVGNDVFENCVILSGGVGGLGVDTTYQERTGFFVKPIQDLTNTNNVLSYNTTSKEISYNSTINLQDIDTLNTKIYLHWRQKLKILTIRKQMLIKLHLLLK